MNQQGGNLCQRPAVIWDMKILSVLIVTAVISAGCGAGAPDPGTSDSAEVLAAAMKELITNNHTFGSGPPPFTEYLIQENLDPFAGEPTESDDSDGRALTENERAAVEAAVADFGPVRWISDPADFQTDDLVPTIEGAAILGVGEAEFTGDEALVPVSLWCGGLCGTWLTYKVEKIEGRWTVTGIEGPIAVS